MSPKQKADPETVTSGESGFESAEESLAPKTNKLWTKPRPPNLFTLIENLFASIIDLN
jgi:hypothetical protein